MDELSKSETTGNPTYKFTAMSKEEILQKHHSNTLSFGISLSEDTFDLIKEFKENSILHKNPHNQRYVAAQPSLFLRF